MDPGSVGLSGKTRRIETGTVCLTRGLCGIPYLTQALSKTLGAEVRTREDGRYAGAVGAALKAAAI